MKKIILLLSLTAMCHTSFAQETGWIFETGGEIHSSPVIKNGTLFIGSGDQSLYAIDQETGKEI